MCLILCGILVWFLADARQLRLEAVKALTLCAGTVIPALFPFMVITGLLVRLGFGQWLAPDMAGLMASLFRLPGCAGSALLLGLVLLVPALEPLFAVAPLSIGMVGAIVGLAFGSMVVIQLLKLIRQ